MLFPPINTPEPTFLDGLGNIALLAAGLTLFVFMLTYGFFFAWRKYPAGRAIMYFVTGLVALLAHSIVSRSFGGDYFLRDLVRLTVYTYLFGVTLRLLITLVVGWLRGNRELGKANHHDLIPPWRARRNERQALGRRQRSERRALRSRQWRDRWGARDDQAAHDAADAHQEAEDRSSSSPTSG